MDCVDKYLHVIWVNIWGNTMAKIKDMPLTATK